MRFAATANQAREATRIRPDKAAPPRFHPEEWFQPKNQIIGGDPTHNNQRNQPKFIDSAPKQGKGLKRGRLQQSHEKKAAKVVGQTVGQHHGGRKWKKKEGRVTEGVVGRRGEKEEKRRQGVRTSRRGRGLIRGGEARRMR